MTDSIKNRHYPWGATGPWDELVCVFLEDGSPPIFWRIGATVLYNRGFFTNPNDLDHTPGTTDLTLHTEPNNNTAWTHVYLL